MSKALEKLKERLREISNLNYAAAVLAWDQRVLMPSGGSDARVAQLSTMAKISHEMFVAPETSDLLEKAEAEVISNDPNSDERAILRIVRKDFIKSSQIPSSLVIEMSKIFSQAQDAWAE